MTDQVMSDLEKRIRAKAVREAEANLLKSVTMAVQAIKVWNPHASASMSMHPYKLVEVAKDLIKENAELIGNHAVAEFHNTYAKLVIEFPDLIEQVKEEAVEEHINNGN